MLFPVVPLKQIKLLTAELSKEKEAIELELDEKIVYQNEDDTWTRFTKIDNIEEDHVAILNDLMEHITISPRHTGEVCGAALPKRSRCPKGPKQCPQ